MLKIKPLINRIFGLLFILFLCFPGVYWLKFVKVFLIFVLIIFAFLKKVKVKKEILTILLVFIFLGLFNTIHGLINNNPGALRVTTVTLLWPILFVLFLGLLEKKDFLKMDKLFIRSFKIILVICFIQVIEAIFNKTNIVGTIFKGTSSNYINLKNGYILITNPAITSLIFLIPYFIAQAFLNREKKYIILSLIGIIVPFITGRRAIIVIIISSIFVFIFLIMVFIRNVKLDFYKQVTKKIKKTIIFGSVILILILSKYSSQIINVFFKNKVDSNSIRYNQLSSLLEGFSNSPLIGNGAGAVASVVRSVDMPWSYELFYVALLFQKGILGFFIYLFGFLWILINILKVFKNNYNKLGYHALSVLVGLICLLIASTTNPYISKLDYMWVIFYPIAIINTIKFRK